MMGGHGDFETGSDKNEKPLAERLEETAEFILGQTGLFDNLL